MAQDPLIPPSPSEEFYAVDHDQGDVFSSDDPFDLFKQWLSLASDKELNDPNAMALATVDEHGMPDVRMVLLKDISEGGLTFHTSKLSAKGRELSNNAQAAINFHWKSIRRQVRFRGQAEEVSAKEASAYFATRARGARIGAWASKQSQPLNAPDALQTSFAEQERRFEGRDVPRPDYWTGYRVMPEEIEFWVNRPYRLHERLLFKKVGAKWSQARLYP